MFKVGDVVRVVGGRRGDRYKVISVHPMYPDAEMMLRNINQTHSSMNFTANNLDGHLELDKIYQRRKKLDNIMDTIDSINIMRHAKETAELNRKIEWMYMMEIRKQKIKQICSRLEKK
jgi:hypothetical protein